VLAGELEVTVGNEPCANCCLRYVSAHELPFKYRF